jgi:hypothetical protein
MNDDRRVIALGTGWVSLVYATVLGDGATFSCDGSEQKSDSPCAKPRCDQNESLCADERRTRTKIKSSGVK